MKWALDLLESRGIKFQWERHQHTHKGALDVCRNGDSANKQTGLQTCRLVDAKQIPSTRISTKDQHTGFLPVK